MSLDQSLSHFFKYFNKFMLFMWRLGWGQWINWSPKYGGRIMVLTHTGRKTGLARQTPVNFAIHDNDIYCIAGFGQTSDWYRNVKANPAVAVWQPDGWWQGVAEEVTAPEEQSARLRDVLQNSGFAAYAAGINPYQVSDEQLAKMTADYRVLRIRRTAALTGPGSGPADLAWIWPLAALILLPLALRRRK